MRLVRKMTLRACADPLQHAHKTNDPFAANVPFIFEYFHRIQRLHSES